MAEQRRNRLKRPITNALVVAGVVLLGLALFSGAWFADDALRLWRISLNWLRFGRPEFNLGQRTLGFDQPLWVMLLTVGFAMGGRLAATAVALQFGLVCMGTALLWACHRLGRLPDGSRAGALRSAAKLVFVGALLAMSNCFREYMAAGLEYALCYFLVALLAFLIARRQAGAGDESEGDGSAAAAAMVGSLLLLTRYDLAWALAPATVVLGWRSRARVRRHWRSVALGCSPLAVWLAFSAVHFGSVFPHRPENELLQALPRAAIPMHGKLYVLSALIQEPLTFLLVALGVAGGVFACRERRTTPLALLLSLGALAYLAHIVWRGGDAVSARMLCPVAIFSAAALACAPAFPVRVYAFAACYVVILFDMGKVSLWNGRASRVARTAELFGEWGLVDDYARQHARTPGATTAFAKLRAGSWNREAARQKGPRLPLLSANPGWDGLVAGPGTPVQDWRAMGPSRPELQGTVAMDVRFKPADAGVLEPVLSLGEPADGTLVMAEHLPRNGLRFQTWKPGAVPIFSRAIPRLDTRVAHRLVIAYGSPAAGRDPLGRFVVMMDGVLLDDFPWPTRHYNFDEVVAAWNVEANPACAPWFAGGIDNLEAARPHEFNRGVWPLTVANRNLIDVRVIFSRVTNSAEPVVVTGSEQRGDIVFVRRVQPGRVVFGHEHWGQMPEMGPVVDIDDAVEHHLQIALGPLFTLSDAIVRPDCVQVTMDGRTVLASRQVLYPFRPTEVSVLDNPLAGSFCGRDFLGEVDAIRTVPLETLVNSVAKVLQENSGPVSLTLRFDGSIMGRGLGLLEIGVRGAGDIVYVILRDPHHARFYYDHWGYGGVSGREVEIDPGRAYVLTIGMGSLSPDGDPRADRATLDGQVVLEGISPSASARDGPIHLLENALVSSNVSAPFDGTCLRVSRGSAGVNLSY